MERQKTVYILLFLSADNLYSKAKSSEMLAFGVAAQGEKKRFWPLNALWEDARHGEL